MIVQLILGLLIGGISMLLAAWGLSHEYPIKFLILWASFAFLMTSVAYAFNMPVLLGKEDGRMSPLSVCLTLPILLFVHGLWWTRRRVSNEATFNEVAPGLYVGRRPLDGEIPADVEAVVDLTCEFSEVRSVREGRRYLSIPTMDGSIPPNATLFRKMVEEIANLNTPIYVHCAYGHGRAALMAAAILIHRGAASSADEAYALLKNARPGVRPNRLQRSWLRRMTPELAP